MVAHEITHGFDSNGKSRWTLDELSAQLTTITESPTAWSNKATTSHLPIVYADSVRPLDLLRFVVSTLYNMAEARDNINSNPLYWHLELFIQTTSISTSNLYLLMLTVFQNSNKEKSQRQTNEECQICCRRRVLTILKIELGCSVHCSRQSINLTERLALAI